MTEENNSIKTKDGDLILDSHKVSYHYDRIEAWENGEKIAPVSVDMALTRACGECVHFVMLWFKNHKKERILKLKKPYICYDFAEIESKQSHLSRMEKALYQKHMFRSFSMHLNWVLMLEMQLMDGNLKKKKSIKFYHI